MMNVNLNNLAGKADINVGPLFEDDYINGKVLYLKLFGKIPNSDFINKLEGESVLERLKQTFPIDPKSVFQHRYFCREHKRLIASSTFLVLDFEILLEIGEYYLSIYHNGDDLELVTKVLEVVKPFKKKERKAPLEINLITRGRHGFDLKAMEINKTKLDLDLYYEDDFKEVHQIIESRLKSKNDKGIVLLHGMPGTGKTTYLRYLIGRLTKRVLFLSPSVAGSLMNPDFVELLVDNPNSVLIIEDAENIIMDRRFNSSSSVSNLLNISDGLMADFLNVQLICSFNHDLAMIDPALLRKGRLIARYEFGKLSVDKGDRLRQHLGLEGKITEPKTLAEITHPSERDEPTMSRVEITGFRKKPIIEN